MYKEFYLVPSKDYNKLINNCKEEVKDEQKQVKNPIDEKKLEDKKDLEYNNVDPQVLLKIYEKLNKMERNNNERNKIEYSLPENTSSSFQRSDGAKLIKYLNEKGLIDEDLNERIRIALPSYANLLRAAYAAQCVPTAVDRLMHENNNSFVQIAENIFVQIVKCILTFHIIPIKAQQ